MADLKLPKYRELPVIEGTKDRHAWGVFGKNDQLGTINLLTEERVKRAATLVRKGKVFNMSLPLNVPDPPFAADRHAYVHTIFSINRNSWDDKIDSFYLQASSQWDSLRHMRYREFGYYGGLQDDDLKQGALGISHWAEHGIVGRGILLDLPRFMQKRGTPLDFEEDTAFDAVMLEEAFASQGTKTQQGDILLLRTGFLGWFLGLPPEAQAKVPRKLGPEGMHTPGLKATPDVAEFLWDRGFAAIVADNPAVEDTPGKPENGFLHRRLLPLLGFALGELFVLDPLANDCAADGTHECMVTGVPLNLPSGVGSPANAIAIK